MKYTVDYFIAKFSAIPDDKWNNYIQYDDNTKIRCAFGLCGIIKPIRRYGELTVDGTNTDEGKALINIFLAIGWDIESGKWVTDINNGYCKEYPQPTPKQRILAALHDIKAMQEPTYPDLTKSLAILPADEVPDRVIVNALKC